MIQSLFANALVASILLAAGILAARCLRRRSAAQRHWVLTLTVACVLAVPLLRGVMPTTLTASIRLPRGAPEAATAVAARADAAAPSTSSVETTITLGAPRPSAAPRIDLMRVAVWLWLGGVAIFLSRMAIGLGRLRSTAAHAARLDTGPWRDACDDACHTVGLRRRVRLLHGADPSLLATWGWRRPVVMLPNDALGWTPDRIRVVLAHELAHVARGDWLHQLAGEALRALHWFNPLAWEVCRRLRLESERASDDAVLALGVEGSEYAAHLVEIARSRHHAPAFWSPAPAMVRPSSLEGRVRAMLDPTTVRRPVSRRTRSLMAMVALTLTLPLAAMTAAAQYHALRGTIVDPTGRALPNAVVRVTNPGTGATNEVRSDAQGRFELVGLTAATYALDVRVTGFRTHAETLAIASDTERALRLAVGTLQETISVVDDGRPDAGPDADVIARRDQVRARAAARQSKAMATCASGPPTDVGGNILPPMKIVHAAPRYPEPQRAAGVGGTVTMRALIDVEGTVRDVRDINGPAAELSAAAAEAVRQWQFTTTLLNCEPIEVEMTVTVTFTPAK